MKRILLNRHAEAANPKGVRDFERPLSAHGIAQAHELTAKLAQNNLVPQQWVSSTALRAQATAQIICSSLAVARLHTNAAIYEADEDTLLNIIAGMDNAYNFIGLTGHNPGISYLLYNLCSEVREVSPCTAMVIDFDVADWAHISKGSGSLQWNYAPR